MIQGKNIESKYFISEINFKTFTGKNLPLFKHYPFYSILRCDRINVYQPKYPFIYWGKRKYCWSYEMELVCNIRSADEKMK